MRRSEGQRGASAWRHLVASKSSLEETQDSSGSQSELDEEFWTCWSQRRLFRKVWGWGGGDEVVEKVSAI